VSPTRAQSSLTASKARPRAVSSVIARASSSSQMMRAPNDLVFCSSSQRRDGALGLERDRTLRAGPRSRAVIGPGGPEAIVNAIGAFDGRPIVGISSSAGRRVAGIGVGERAAIADDRGVLVVIELAQLRGDVRGDVTRGHRRRLAEVGRRRRDRELARGRPLGGLVVGREGVDRGGVRFDWGGRRMTPREEELPLGAAG